jgi:hypothetical protein
MTGLFLRDGKTNRISSYPGRSRDEAQQERELAERFELGWREREALRAENDTPGYWRLRVIAARLTVADFTRRAS